MTSNQDFLSQEEIDALMKEKGGEHSEQSSLDIREYISSIEQDALGEIGNIAFGSSATALSTLLGRKVDITTPQVSVIAFENLADEFPEPHVAVYVKYVEGFQGINLLVIKQNDAQMIADLMLGGEGLVDEDAELNEIHLSAVQEAMNQMMGSAATSMSTIFNRMVNISPPGIDILDMEKDGASLVLPDEEVYVKVSFRLIIEGLIDSQIMQLLTVSFSKEMIAGIMGEQVSGLEEEATSSPQQAEHEAAASAKETSATAEKIEPSVQPESPVRVQPVQYADLSPNDKLSSDNVNLDLLLDIPLKVSVELGRAKKRVQEILEFTQGSIIELDKLAGEPVDILVNDTLIAKGEVVVIDENFGVRVTDIVSKMERISKLK